MRAMKQFLFDWDHKYNFLLIYGIILFEFLLHVFIINKVPYTEIDWKAYMQEVNGFLNGEYDYKNLKGDTGPLVYPAGFVYIYSILYFITDRGRDIATGQWIFAAIYINSIFIVIQIYKKSRIAPPWTLLLLSLSKRMHSIYSLRLFNDPVSMLFMYVSIYFLQRSRYVLACILYSVAMSVKMNILLFLPVFGLIVLGNVGLKKTFFLFGLICAIQLLIGGPFLFYNPLSYLSRSFDFSRIFLYKWSVNWKFIPEEIFLSGYFSNSLLINYCILSLFFANDRWTAPYGGLAGFIKCKILGSSPKPRADSVFFKQDPALMLFIGQLIGILCARSLHYQFYSWYAWTIPFLAWKCVGDYKNFSEVFKVAFTLSIFFSMELAWNIYPATWWSSLILWLCHTVLLIFLHVAKQFESSLKIKSKTK